MDSILRLHDVPRITGASRSSIYLWVSAGIFPQPVKLGVRAVGWRRSEVQQWLDDRR
ncbi:MAG: AlpA family transcriptional regulator [Halothiobacillus sp. 15-55-196]|uniref:helix-turn-helix transcriptional regulator n=1 Tax=Halothiobacillus sp. 15-55-196 TaxID=1970382 RepID=UPI000BD70468|nr:AlpA family phage regulatory protein [Halothiobacillus sp. 15-55-196]OZB35360.1 MAG: AlpA family transcriptional regulator [Halothiobacillus sp. 15-55-196]